MKPKFRAVFRGALYACFAVMNQALLVREKNRVFIDDEVWLRIKEDLDRTTDADIVVGVIQARSGTQTYFFVSRSANLPIGA